MVKGFIIVFQRRKISVLLRDCSRAVLLLSSACLLPENLKYVTLRREPKYVTIVTPTQYWL